MALTVGLRLEDPQELRQDFSLKGLVFKELGLFIIE